MAERVLTDNLHWMGWNLLLGVVPVALAFWLFRGRRALNGAWWVGLAAFVAFLPNAPYVLTDVKHLPDDLALVGLDRSARIAVNVQYLAFFLAGAICYAASITLAEGWLRARGWSARRLLVVELVTHVACAVGVFLGRVMRFNSWDLVTRPADVLAAVEVPQPTTVVVLAMLAVVLATATTALRVFAVASIRVARVRLR